MIVTHTFTIGAHCPVDGSKDTYEAELTVADVLPVESILAAAARLSRRTLYQEELTRQLQSELGGTLTTRGTHSGVVTTVTVEGLTA